jgi:hypothetical protein
MAAPAPTVADLQVLIQTLQAQNALLQAALSAVPAAGAAAVVTFADTPQMLNANDLLNYSTKRGSSIYEKGCKALDNKAFAGGFGMTTDQTVVFLKQSLVAPLQWDGARAHRKSLPLPKSGGTPVDLIKCYGKINKATLNIACKRFLQGR